MIVFTVASYIVVICLNAFYCQPISSNWYFNISSIKINNRSLSTENQCLDSPSYAVFFPSVVLNIVADLMSTIFLYPSANLVFILPFFLLRKLQVSRRQLWGLISIFGLGGIAILMSVARIVALGFSASTAEIAIWTALECSIAIVVACCPALRLFFRRPEDRSRSVMYRRGSQHLELAKNRGESQQSSKPLTQPEKADKVSGEFDLVEASNEQYIFKTVDFEIVSERHSLPPAPPLSPDDEMGWESAARRKGL